MEPLLYALSVGLLNHAGGQLFQEDRSEKQQAEIVWQAYCFDVRKKQIDTEYKPG